MLNFEVWPVLAFIGSVFVFVFASVGVATVYVFAQIGREYVQKHYKDSKQADQLLTDATRDWADGLGDSGRSRR